MTSFSDRRSFMRGAALSLLLLPSLARAQDLGPLDFEVTGPDLSQLFKDRPPMGACPAGDGGPGALPKKSHLLHLGVAEFYLNHKAHLALTSDQQARLKASRAEARAQWLEDEERIQALEVRLWELTGAEPTSLEGVAAVVLEIAGRRADQRLAYVRAVSEAAGLLTAQQRKRLLGVRSSAAPPAGEGG